MKESVYDWLKGINPEAIVNFCKVKGVEVQKEWIETINQLEFIMKQEEEEE